MKLSINKVGLLIALLSILVIALPNYVSAKGTAKSGDYISAMDCGLAAAKVAGVTYKATHILASTGGDPDYGYFIDLMNVKTGKMLKVNATIADCKRFIAHKVHV